MKITKYLPLLIIFVTSSCGFSPIYKVSDSQKSNNYQIELAAIKIEQGKKHLHQKLRGNLEELLNPNNSDVESKYLLQIDVSKYTHPTFITSSGSSGRNKVVINANYKLRNIKLF